MKKLFFFVVMIITMDATQMHAQSVTISPSSATICAGSGTNVMLQATPAGGFPISYAWSNGSAGSTITVSPSSTTTYTVTATLTTGTATANVIVTVTPQPAQATITPIGPTTVCVGNTVSLQASAGSMYQWYFNGNPISSSNINPYQAGISGNYTVFVTVGSCNAPMSTSTTATILPLPTANVTPAGPVTQCYGNTVTLTADPVIGASYQWWYSLTGNISGTWSIISGATNQTYNAGTTGDVGVQVTIGGCTNRSFIP